MPAKQFGGLTTTESRVKIWHQKKIHLRPSLVQAAVRSKAVVLLLLIYCLMHLQLFVGVLCLSLFCYALLCVHSSFEIILKKESKLVALLLLSYIYIVTVNALWLSLTVPWVGLQCAIVILSHHTHLLVKTTIIPMSALFVI